MLTPRDEADLAEVVASAKDPLMIQGGGTRPVGPKVEGEVLSVAGLSGITLYEPGALTLVARVGTPVAEIQAALAAENQMLAFEPMDHRSLLATEGEPTIGGVVAANVSGPRRVQAGACRDYLLGVRLVDGRGDIIKNGGRVMKNVTGYDLARLMCGARGTLGVLSEVSLKVLPKPETSATLVFDGLDLATTADLLIRALTTPFEVTGAARLPSPDGSALLRLEGFEASVVYRSGKLADHLGLAPSRVETDPDQNARLWRSVRDVTPFADREGDIWSLSIKPTDLTALANALPQADMLVDWACGRVWLCTPAGTNLREKLIGTDGHATLVRASEDTKTRLGVFHPEAAPLAQIAKEMRQQFDPRSILNTGLMA